MENVILLLLEIYSSMKCVFIQNMCPVSLKHIKNEYIDLQADITVKVDGMEPKMFLLTLKKKNI